MFKRLEFVASGCFAILLSASAAQAAPVFQIYGTYTDSVTNVTAGDNAPTIVNNGLVQGNHATSTYFTVNNLVVGGPAGNATSGGGLLFTVDPAACLNNAHCNGTSVDFTETANINIAVSFYSSAGALYGTLTDTALATFDYKHQTDNLCWQDSAVGGTVVVAHQLVGTCGLPGSGSLANAFEQATVNLGGTKFNMDFHDWNDWNETPSVTFQLVSTPVPEPITLSLFGTGLAGLVAMRRRRKNQA